MSRAFRCAACARRIKPHHAHIGLKDLEAETEISYHARQSCQQSAAEEFAAMVERGRVYVLRHYHSAACPDERPGFGCAGGCFDTPPVAVAN